MCGIVGLFGPANQQALSAFEGMLAADIVRGKDSTGVAAIRNDGSVGIAKDIMFPTELMRTTKYRKHVRDKASECIGFIGHNRAATRGVISAANAHPFNVGHITMVHNGTLNEFMKPDDLKYDTDSISLANAISKKGIHWTWKNLNGPAAVLFFDSTARTFNFVTNGARPLHFAETEDRKHVFVASEPWIIEEVVPCYGIKLQKVFAPKDDNLFSYTYDEKKKRLVNIGEELEDKFSKYRWHRGGFGGNRGGGPFEWETGDDEIPPLVTAKPSSSSGAQTTPGSATKATENVVPFKKDEPAGFSDIVKVITDRGWFMAKDVMAEKEFIAANLECIFCREDLSKLHHNTVLIDDDTAVCYTCAGISITSPDLLVQFGGKNEASGRR